MKNKKGSTLAELIVVLAIVSILSVMVVSFTAMFSNRAKANRAKMDAINDIILVEHGLENWFSSLTLLGADFSVDDGGNLIATLNENNYSVTLNRAMGNLVAQMPDKEPIYCPVSAVTKVSFKYLENAGKTDDMLVVYVTYEIPFAGDTKVQEFTHVLCVNLHVGDILQGGGA